MISHLFDDGVFVRYEFHGWVAVFLRLGLYVTQEGQPPFFKSRITGA